MYTRSSFGPRRAVARAAIVAALALVSGLTGCGSMSTRDRDTLVGAGVGTAAGAAIGGNVGGAVVGGVVGGVVGNQIGKDK
jgi:osmotically inducible lipoprotein OsmB